MTDKPPVMVPAEQAHLLVKNAGGVVVAALEQGDHSVLPVRCVAERILAKILGGGGIVPWGDGSFLVDTYDRSGFQLSEPELALILRLIAEDSE